MNLQIFEVGCDVLVYSRIYKDALLMKMGCVKNVCCHFDSINNENQSVLFLCVIQHQDCHHRSVSHHVHTALTNVSRLSKHLYLINTLYNMWFQSRWRRSNKMSHLWFLIISQKWWSVLKILIKSKESLSSCLSLCKCLRAVEHTKEDILKNVQNYALLVHHWPHYSRFCFYYSSQ